MKKILLIHYIIGETKRFMAYEIVKRLQRVGRNKKGDSAEIDLETVLEDSL